MASDQSVADVFGLLSDATRIAILRAVAEAQADCDEINLGPTELTFSEIYDRVNVDNTSKLPYHLGELTGTHLRKHEDSYSFTHAGERVVRFILAETYEQPAESTPTETDGCCPFCGAPRARPHAQFSSSNGPSVTGWSRTTR
jgi:DNA-binding transcriptional ArsR family regulator